MAHKPHNASSLTKIQSEPFPKPPAIEMSIVQILQSTPRQQTASPLFGSLPAELRLMIYKLIFMSCFVSAWFDHEFFDDGASRPSRTAVEIPWYRFGEPLPAASAERFRKGRCCFSHTGWGFGFLVTCRTAYIEAFDIYWGNVTLEVARDLERTGCGLVSVCAYLPDPVKQQLRHLRNVRLPIMEVDPPEPGDPAWTPALLRQLPSLATLEFTSMVLSGQALSPLAWVDLGDLVAGPVVSELETFMGGTGPFRVMTGESPAEFIERSIGVRPSSGVTLLSTMTNPDPYVIGRVYGRCYDPRHYNWTTGMVYLSPGFRETARNEKLYQIVLAAPQSQEWTRATRSAWAKYD